VLLALFNAVPPLDAAYQSITAPDDDARSATVPVPQREAAVTDGFAGRAFTVAVTVAALADWQVVPLEVRRA
jgi:hypothetical protein